MFPLMHRQIAAIHPPMVLTGFFFIGGVHQRQQVLRQVGRDTRVDVINLARLTLKRGIQPAAQHIQVTLIGQACRLFITGKLA